MKTTLRTAERTGLPSPASPDTPGVGAAGVGAAGAAGAAAVPEPSGGGARCVA
ncbi:hypothetical protein [Streptomyces sp. NPDC051567]|uniref:hypothetical protein n=1 Tax=Streptomyces sp. NPDC051567 TaxID=3365660 RepID=UPI00378FB4FB